MPEAQTPLMRQYSQIKAKYPDTILLFRMGDFFETFENDAVITSKVLGITLTKRANGAASDVPLAGFPHHALDNYLPKLVKAGYKVAVCEQLEDPKLARGIVKRDVIEVVTPGITFSDKLLDHKSNNYLCLLQDDKWFSFCDISTGEFLTSEIKLKNVNEQIELVNPAEIIISKSQKNLFSDLQTLVSGQISGRKITITKLDEWIFGYDYCNELLLAQFKTKSLKGFGIEEYPLGVIAAGGILNYINETQKGNLAHISKISYYDTSDYIALDNSTKRI
jgi:DNA mismatch repair protein MutS